MSLRALLERRGPARRVQGPRVSARFERACGRLKGACLIRAESGWFSEEAPGSAQWGGAKPSAESGFLNNRGVFGALEVVPDSLGPGPGEFRLRV